MDSKEQLERSGLSDLYKKWNTLSEIGDNDMGISYESSLSAIVPLTSVEVGDIVSHANTTGLVESVTLGNVGVSLGLSSIVVKYADPYNYKSTGNYYKRVVFVFGKTSVDQNDYEYPVTRPDISHAVFVDSSTIKIIKRSSGTYKNEIEKVLDLIKK